MNDDLTDAELAELGQDLDVLEAELSESIEASKTGIKPVDLDQPIGRVSRMDAIQQQKMAQATRRRAEVRLGQVRQAKQAIERGDYGECRNCEEPIGYPRLKVKPETPICMECQSEVERRR